MRFGNDVPLRVGYVQECGPSNLSNQIQIEMCVGEHSGR